MTVMQMDIERAAGIVPETEPTEEPVTLAEAKDQMNVVLSHWDAYITNRLIPDAREHYANDTGLQLVTASRKYYLRKFPRGEAIKLPWPPLQEDNFQIDYVDTDGNSQTLAASVYDIDPHSLPGEVVEAYGQRWPEVRDQKNAITISYDCGFGTASEVPGLHKKAILKLVALDFEMREAAADGRMLSMPQSYVDIVNAVGVNDRFDN
jgi:uncharacterized phiE125 gp8 family phage protein